MTQCVYNRHIILYLFRLLQHDARCHIIRYTCSNEYKINFHPAHLIFYLHYHYHIRQMELKI